jgi:20S proteasome subunit beta 2
MLLFIAVNLLFASANASDFSRTHYSIDTSPQASQSPWKLTSLEDEYLINLPGSEKYLSHNPTSLDEIEDEISILESDLTSPHLQLSIKLPHSHDTTSPLSSAWSPPPFRLTSTGTTIAGLSGPDFVVLGADTRATNGPMVADTRAAKIHALAPKIFACGAGTSADLQHLTRECYYTHKLEAMQYASIGNTGQSSEVSVKAVVRWLQNSLYETRGQVGANLVVGGVYKDQAVLYAIHPHGSVDGPLQFTALGSGGLAAMGVLEQGYRPNMDLQEAVDLVKRAILAGIQNDLGSGSQVDICVLQVGKEAELTRAAVPEEEMERRPMSIDDILKQETGVNGFGSVPFAILSKKQLVVSPKRGSKASLDDLLSNL